MNKLRVLFLFFALSFCAQGVWAQGYITGEFVSDDVRKVELLSKTKSLRENKMNMGAHFLLSYAMPVNGKENKDIEALDNIKSFEGWYGTKSGLGFILNYYVKDNIALEGGFDFNVMALFRSGMGEKIVFEGGHDSYKDGLFRASVNQQAVALYELSLPVSIRFDVTELVWVRAGLLLEFAVAESVYYTLLGNAVTLYNDSSSGDPFEPESAFLPSLSVGAGVTLPIEGLNVDAGLNLQYGLAADIDYKESANILSIGVVFNVWFI